MLKRSLAVFLLFFGASLSGWTATITTPYMIVEDVTAGILNIIQTHKAEFEEDPKPFFCDLEKLLENRVDFHFIAKNVMGPYAKQATDEQVARFKKVFKEDLIQTYARGLMSYGDQKIVLLPTQEDIEGKRRLTVYQEIRNKEDTYPLNYSFGLNQDGQWKVTNLVLNGINLGKTFRNQFIQRARAADNDIDIVIDQWSSKVELQNESTPKNGTSSN